jgi:hypothetical protein
MAANIRYGTFEISTHLRIGKIGAGVAAGQAAAVSKNTGCGN